MDRASELREQMVATLEQRIHPRPQTLAALREVPRHLFLPGVALDRVYSGAAIPTHHDDRGMPTSSSSEPGVMAVMIDALQLERGQHVLEIGAGTGYNAAILASLVGEENVVSVDIEPAICDEARAHLASAGYGRLRVEVGDGWDGWPARAPYDRIELTASTPDISPAWIEQLEEGGLMAAPLLLRGSAQAIVVFRKSGHVLESTTVSPGGFMPLRGRGAPETAWTEAGAWRIAASSPIDGERVAALLASRPCLEVIEDLTWNDLALFAIAHPRSIILQREMHSRFIGLLGTDGIAFVDTTPLVAPRFVLTSFGSPAVGAQMLQALADLHARAGRGIRVTATPSDVPARGDVVFPRENYTFAVTMA